MKGFSIDSKQEIVYIKIMWPGLVRIIFFAFLVYSGLRIFRFIQALGTRTIPKAERPSKNLSGVMVKDEICQIYLPKEDAIKELKEGKEYFFCSRECQEKSRKIKR
jgi:YHS domain-containing protein